MIFLSGEGACKNLNRTGRYFNSTGVCDPKRHYMVDIQERLKDIKKMVDAGEYFTINKARQYGKTTTIRALKECLKKEYAVISLDFQMIGNEEFENAHIFSAAFSAYLLRTIRNRHDPVSGLEDEILDKLDHMSTVDPLFSLGKLFVILSELCDTAQKPVVLIIDEVDSATNNQVFLDFLAQLRGYFLKMDELPPFQSVILAGVYDVKNMKRKIRPDESHKVNSPWNIAADFKIDMSLPEEGIVGMLRDYETDHRTGMNLSEMASLIYDYTSGYPFLVSRICKLIDEDVAGSKKFPDETTAWTKEGFLEAVRKLLSEKNTLFESLMGKLQDYPELKEKVYSILFAGEKVVFSPFDSSIDVAIMFGFAKSKDGTVIISNRIFETILYDFFLTAGSAQNHEIFQMASQNKNLFIRNGHLDIELVLKKYVDSFDSIYGDNPEKFNEEEGRRRFLLYLRPIINGTGNYYIEPETRNARRMDIVVDYRGEQFIIELKIWRGNAYHERGEKQLSDYLDYFHLEKGYMLSYNFNKKKKNGVKKIRIGDRVLVEAVV